MSKPTDNFPSGADGCSQGRQNQPTPDTDLPTVAPSPNPDLLANIGGVKRITSPFHFQIPQLAQPDQAYYMLLANQWADLIAARGKCAEYVAERRMQLLWVLEQTAYDLTDAPVTIAIGKLRARGVSARTLGKYLAVTKSFTRWLARPSARVLAFDPLVELEAPSINKDRRHVRTSFLPVLALLLETTIKSKRLFQGIGGRDRAELYHAAACTGLREGTLTVVEVGQFHLSADPAFVRVNADQIKNGKNLDVPIQRDSAARIQLYLAGKMPRMRAFRTPARAAYFIRMLRADLKEAGITYCREVKTAGGETRREEVLDFHALRGTANTFWAECGVDLAIRQLWMSHSDSRLTEKTYTFQIPEAQAAAVRRLPALPGVIRCIS